MRTQRHIEARNRATEAEGSSDAHAGQRRVCIGSQAPPNQAEQNGPDNAGREHGVGEQQRGDDAAETERKQQGNSTKRENTQTRHQDHPPVIERPDPRDHVVGQCDRLSEQRAVRRGNECRSEAGEQQRRG